MILVFFSACGSSSSSRAREADSSGTGSINFNLDWGSISAPRIRTLSPSGNACIDYGIEAIEAKVYKDPNTVIASGSCQCDANQSTITDVPEGSGYSLVVEALVSGISLWRGEITDITVIPGDTTELGSIVMSYIGDDNTHPSVQPVTPSSGATDVPIDINIIVLFNENIIEASLNPNTFILESAAGKVSGTITYNSESMIATFEPDAPLSYSITYTATIKKQVQDKNSLELSNDFVWNFTTEMDSLIWDEGKWDEAKWIN
ncbi:MAG: Ig-like domain-containing protein [bacterium]